MLTLGVKIIEGFTELRWNLLTPATPKNRAGNIAASTPMGGDLAAALTERRIHCSGDHGRLRASVHLFNSDDDIDELLDALDAPLGRLRPAGWGN